MSKTCGCPCTCETKPETLEGGVVSTSPTEKPKRKRTKKVKPVVDETKIEQVEVQVKPKKTRKALPKPEAVEEKPKRPVSAWVQHVQAFRQENPTMSYKEAMMKARETYSK